MKKIILTLALGLAVLVTVSAQEKNGKPRGKRIDGQFMSKELNLTEDQKVKAQELRNDFETKMVDLYASHQASFLAILTPEQKTKAEAMFNQKKDQKSNRKADGKRGDGKMDGYAKLSDEAKGKINTLKETYETEKKAIEMSRIAPDVQKSKLTELETKFKADRRAIVKAEKRKK